MDARERDRFRKLLEAQRAALVAEGDVDLEPERSGETVHEVDEDAAPLTEMNQVIASNRNRERTERLRRIDAALDRVNDPDEEFGVCEACGEAIGLRRLELMPWTRLCLDCQAENERNDPPKTRRHLTDYHT